MKPLAEFLASATELQTLPLRCMYAHGYMPHELSSNRYMSDTSRRITESIFRLDDVQNVSLIMKYGYQSHEEDSWDFVFKMKDGSKIKMQTELVRLLDPEDCGLPMRFQKLE